MLLAIANLADVASNYLERIAPKRELQRDIDARIQSRILPHVQTINMMRVE